MASAPIPTALVPKRQFWQQHITAWQHSGLSQNAYCRQEGLRPSSFRYWLRKDSGCDTSAGPAVVALSAAQQQGVAPAAWTQGGIRLHRGPYTLEIEPEGCQQTLRHVLDVLEQQLCCR